MTPKAFNVNYTPDLLEDVRVLRTMSIEIAPLIRQLIHEHRLKLEKMNTLYDQLDRSVGIDEHVE